MLATGMSCPACATTVAGRWSACVCPYCRLGDEQRALLEIFLTSRGNTKEIERYLGVSYPTARARLDALLVSLGLADASNAAEERAARLEILKELAGGQITVDDAAAALKQNG